MELKNIVSVNGKYNNNEITLTSNTSTINLINSLIIDMSTNKNIWNSGILTYNMTIDNQTSTPYYHIRVSELIDTNFVELVKNSITINNTQTDNYIYINNQLIIDLEEIEKESKTVVTFSIRKKRDDFFVLKNNFKIEYDSKIQESNYVTVTSLIKKGFSNNNYCGKPYWRE